MKTRHLPLALGLLIVALLALVTAVPALAGLAPTIFAQTFTIAENSPVGSPTSPLKVQAFELEGQALTYEITGGTGQDAFNINASNGNLTVKDNTLLDREARAFLTLDVKVTDTESLSASATMTVNLTGVSEFPPVLDPQTFDIDENSPNGSLVGTVLAQDDDIGETFTYAIVSESATNVFSIDANDGEIRVKTSTFVNHEAVPTVTLGVKVTDSGGSNVTENMTVNINDVNETPVLNNQSFSVSESAPAGTDVGFVIATDPDDGDTLTYSIVGPSPFSINAGTGLLKVENPDGIDFETDPDITFTVKVVDAGTPAKEDTGVITVNVIEADDPPTTSGIADKVVNEGTASTTVSLFPAFADDEDADAALVYSVTSVSKPSLVTSTSINPANGVLTINLASGVGGFSNITVQAKDTADQTVSATFKVIINEAPTADPIPDIIRNEDQLDESLDLRDFFSDDVDAPADLVYTIKSNSAAGLFSTAAISDYTLNLVGAANASGTANLTLKATDSLGLFVEQVLKVKVNEVNDPPTTTGISNVNVDEDAPPREINLWAAFSDIEDDDDQLTFVVANNSNPGLFDSVTVNNGNGKLTLTFKANTSGVATITIQAEDTNGATVNTSFTVNVGSINDRPVVENFSKDTTEDTPVNFTENDFINHYSDADDEPLTKVRITQLPEANKGVLKLGGADVGLNDEIPVGQLDDLVFKPAANWDQGTSTFKWNGSDGTQYAENPATVTINMTAAVNDPPVVSNFSKTVNESAVLSFGISDFVNAYFDVDGDQLAKVRIVQRPDNGTLRLNNNPVDVNDQINRDNLDALTFTPTAGWSGETSFKWNGSDGEVYADEAAAVNITVTPINDPPVVDLNGNGSGVNFAVVFNTNGSPVKIADSDATVSDEDSATLSSATIIIENRKDGSAEKLTAKAAGTSISIDFNANNGIMTLQGPAPAVDFQAVIRTIEYSNTAPGPNTTKRQISVRVTDDGQLLSPNALSEVTIINPRIQVTVKAETPVVISGTAAVFTVSIKNIGDVDLNDIEVTSDAVPDCNRSFASVAAGQSLQTYSCVQANVTKRLDNEVKVTATDSQGGSQVSDTDTAVVKVESPNIRVDIAPDPSVGDTILKGQEAKFVVTVLNPSQSVALQEVKVEAFTSPLPVIDGVEPDQSPLPVCNKTIGDLDPNEDQDYTCSVANVQAPFEIEVVISGKIEGTNQIVQDFDILELNVLDLKVEAQADPFEILSDQQTKVRYNITLTNNGSKDVTLKQLVSRTPGGQSLHGDLLNPNNGIPVNNTCDITGDPAVLVAGGGTYSCYYEVNITAQPPAYSNVIAATVEDEDENQVTAEVTALVTVSDQSPLQLTLTAEPSSLLAPGGNLTLNLQLTNNQPATAQLTALNDLLQGNLNGKGTCETPQTIAPGGSYACSYPATVSGQDAGDVVSFTVSATVGGKTIADSIQVPITAKGTKQIMLPAVPHFAVAGEPNDSVCTAMAIATDSNYYFTPDDANDWYRFTLSEEGSVTVKISNYVATGQIVVYKGACDAPTFIQNNGDNGVVLNRSVNLGNQMPGTYYVWVLADGQQSETKPYTLHVETD